MHIGSCTTSTTCTQVATASQHLQTGASHVNMLSTYCSCKDLPVFVEEGTAAAATTMYTLSSQGPVPVHIVDSPLSQTAPKCNPFDEPACNPCYKTANKEGMVCLLQSFFLTMLPLFVFPNLMFSPNQNFWVFLLYHAFPSIPLSVCHSQPTTDEPASSSRADLPLAATRVTIAATSSISSSLPAMVSSGRPAHAPLSAHGCLYRGRHSLISRTLGKAVFCSCWEQLDYTP